MASAAGIKAGKAFISIEAVDKTGMILKRVSKNFREVGAKMTGMGLGLTKTFGGIAGALTGAVTHFSKTGSAFAKISKQTGASVAHVSKLAGAAKELGIDTDDVVGSMEELNIRLGEAVQDGTGPLAEQFKKLGIDAKQFSKLPITEQYAQLADVLAGIENPAERQFVADELFGGDAFKILPLLEQGGAALNKQLAEIKGWTEKDASAAALLSKTWHKLTATFWRVVDTVGSALAPMFQKLLDTAVPLLQWVADWVSKNKQLVRMVFLGATAMVGLGGAIAGLGVVISTVGTILGGLATAFSLLTSPIGLIIAGLAGATAAFLAFTDTGKELRKSLASSFLGMVDTVKTSIGAMSRALAAGNFVLAGKIAWATLKLIWFQGTQALMDKWTDFKTALARGMLETVGGLKVIWVEFKHWFIGMVDSLANIIGKGIFSVIKTYVGVWEKLLGEELFAKLEQTLGMDLNAFANFDVGGFLQQQAQAREQRKNQVLSQLAREQQQFAATLGQMNQEEKKARQRTIDGLKAELDELNLSVPDPKDPLQASFDTAKAETRRKVDMLGDVPQASRPVIAPPPMEAVMKGSIDVIKQVQTNRFNLLNKEQKPEVEELQKVNQTLEKIQENTEPGEGGV